MTATTTQRTDRYPTRKAGARTIERTDPTVWGTAQDGPFTATELDAHERRGFTILEEETYNTELTRLANDQSIRGDERVITERSSGEMRSIFEVQHFSELIDRLSRDPRVLGRARQLLGSDVYLHQTRVNYMPGFKGSGFYWHSDFETWHAEDGMVVPRAVSLSIALTDNYPFNGGLMVMPGSHLRRRHRRDS